MTSFEDNPLNNSKVSGSDADGGDDSSFNSGSGSHSTNPTLSESFSSNPEEPPEPEAFDQCFNVLLLGDSGVGKTDLVNRLSTNLTNQIPDHECKAKLSFATIGINMETHFMDLDDKKIKFQIWDPSGSDRFRSMITKYFQNAHGIILMYDLNYYKSFQSIKDWTQQIQNHPDLNYNQIGKLLIGNKVDVNKRSVSWEEASQFADKNNMRYLETSTITGENVDNCFRALGQEMIRLYRSGKFKV